MYELFRDHLNMKKKVVKGRVFSNEELAMLLDNVSESHVNSQKENCCVALCCSTLREVFAEPCILTRESGSYIGRRRLKNLERYFIEYMYIEFIILIFQTLLIPEQ